jgi:hypothetical protein
MPPLISKPDILALDPYVAEAARQVRARWSPTIRYLRRKGVTTLNGRQLDPEELAKELKEQNRWEAPTVHVFLVDRYRFGMGPWRSSST